MDVVAFDASSYDTLGHHFIQRSHHNIQGYLEHQDN